MGRPKGIPKTGGRKKGSNFAGTLREQLSVEGIDLLGDFLSEMKVILEPTKKCDLILKLMQFIYPKPTDGGYSVETMPEEELHKLVVQILNRVESEKLVETKIM